MTDAFKPLLDSMLQCICELWDAADSPEKKKLLIQGLESLLSRLQLLNQAGAVPPERGASRLGAESNSAIAFQSVSKQARDMLGIVLSASGLLEKHGQQLTPERQAEEFQKIRQAVQGFALLLDESAI